MYAIGSNPILIIKMWGSWGGAGGNVPLYNYNYYTIVHYNNKLLSFNNEIE